MRGFSFLASRGGDGTDEADILGRCPRETRNDKREPRATRHAIRDPRYLLPIANRAVATQTIIDTVVSERKDEDDPTASPLAGAARNTFSSGPGPVRRNL